MSEDNVVELEEISVCPECGGRTFEIVETRTSDGPYCRCSHCKWGNKDAADPKAGEPEDGG